MFRAATLFALVGGALASIGPVTDLTIKNSFHQPDGFNRSFVTFDGTIPGPIIAGNKGDTFQINLSNELTNSTMLLSTSIHWHGIFQETSAWADGPAFVTQCPIAANSSFLYEFPVPDQAGTFWYHSHLATQYCDQATGALIVYDPEDPLQHLYDVDDDGTVLQLSILYHVPSTMQLPGFTTPNALLVNGLGRMWNNTEPTPLSVVSVTKGLSYRFRIIHEGCDHPINVSFDFHTFLAIESDGIEHEPVVADWLTIYVAQRYSVVVTANQSVDNYWIKAIDNGNGPHFNTGGVNSAILRYVGAPDAEPTRNQTVLGHMLLETEMIPLVDAEVPGGPAIDDVDMSMDLQLFWEVGTPELGNFFFINGVQFHPPTPAVLMQIISGVPANQLMPVGSVYSIPLNASIQLSFNTSQVFPHGGPHPFHLHGQKFSVIRPAGTDQYNFKNAIQRDVVDTGNAAAGDNVTIRFQTINPGPWFLHCHIDWHLEAGFAIVFAQGSDAEITDNNPTPEDWDKLCPTYETLTPAQLGGDGGPTE